MSPATDSPLGTCNLNGKLHAETCGCIDWIRDESPAIPQEAPTPDAQAEWELKRDALRVQFPLGAHVETVPQCFGLESGDGLSAQDNHDGGEPVRGIVTGHSASRVEFAQPDGTRWTMQPASLRLLTPPAPRRRDVLEVRRCTIAAQYRAVCAEIKAAPPCLDPHTLPADSRWTKHSRCACGGVVVAHGGMTEEGERWGGNCTLCGKGCGENENEPPAARFADVFARIAESERQGFLSSSLRNTRLIELVAKIDSAERHESNWHAQFIAVSAELAALRAEHERTTQALKDAQAHLFALAHDALTDTRIALESAASRLPESPEK